MKYLYAIIRHIWPRQRWQIIKEIEVWPNMEGAKHPIAYRYVLRNQFGDIKSTRTDR